MKHILDIQYFGRGSSKAGGGGGSGAPTVISSGGGNIIMPPPSTANTVTADADDTQQAPQLSSSYDAFMNMTDDERADAITSAIAKSVPDHLNNRSDYQKLIYDLNMNDKPQVVDDSTLDAMNGTECFRTVNSVFNKSSDISFTAPQIAKQTQAGRYTRVSSDGQACYGDGIYFAQQRRDSVVYGNTRGNIQKTCVMRAKLNSNAKIISYNSARRGAMNEMSSGSKLGRALRRCESESAVSIYALSKGYNVIDAGNGYLNVINRGALTMSKTITMP